MAAEGHDQPEHWRPVTCAPGYEVSDRGRVRSMDRTITYRDGRRRRYPGRVLSPTTNPVTGYQHVRVAGRSEHIHTLVLRAFVGPPGPGQETRHGNGRRTDNRLVNLSWGTSTQNNLDQIRHGTHVPGGPARDVGEPCRPQCGTPHGRKIHSAKKEASCRPCLDAHAAAERRRRTGTPTRRPLSPCGTDAAYARHRRRGEVTDAASCAAHSAAEARRRARRLARDQQEGDVAA